MTKKILLIIFTLALLFMFVALFLVRRQNRQEDQSNLPRTNPYAQKSATEAQVLANPDSFQQGPDPATVAPTTDYILKFYDLYGKEIKSKSMVKVDDHTFDTTYVIELENITPPTGNNKYEAWLQTEEGVRTPLGDLTVGANKVGKMTTKGGRPESNWYVLIIYHDLPKNEETLVYRANLEISK